MDESATATLTRPEVAPALVEKPARRCWRTYVTDVREEADRRAVITARTTRDTAIVLLTAAVCLTLNEYLAAPRRHRPHRRRARNPDSSARGRSCPSWAM